ncbi:MAG: hotdog fold thioesterase [Acidimicrobiales bacterium]
MISPSAAEMLANDSATPHLGIELVEATPTAAVARLTVTADMTNGLDVCHGGIVFALADTALAFAANAESPGALTTSASVEFMRPARVGDVLTATAVPIGGAGRTALYEVGVVGKSDELVASIRGSIRRI